MTPANDNGKTCCTCGLTKPLSAFAKDKSKKDGHHSKCHECVKAYKAAHAKRINEQRKAYREANKEAIAQYMKEYRKSYREQNRERLSAASSAWNAANKERFAEIRRLSRRNNPDAARSVVRNRRARLRGNGGSHTAADIQDIGKMQRWRCACCKTHIASEYQVDHITPIAAGGSNERTNLQLLCAPCNLAKNAKHPVDFMQSRGFLC